MDAIAHGNDDVPIFGRGTGGQQIDTLSNGELAQTLGVGKKSNPFMAKPWLIPSSLSQVDAKPSC
jgi:hypothetical protein